MGNKIEWTRKAHKQLGKIPKKDRISIVNAVDGLADLQSCKNVKALKAGSYSYRLRVGNYRVLFDHKERVRIILIQEVKRRNEKTY